MFLETPEQSAYLRQVNYIYLILAGLLTLGCARKSEVLEVNSFQLRDQNRQAGDAMVGMEKLRRLYGAVSMQERQERLGQYYTIRWNDPAGAGKGPVKVIFRYQQGATASLVKEVVSHVDSNQGHGSVEFSVIGENYFKNGKVLAWQATLERGGKILGTRQSYLWQ